MKVTQAQIVSRGLRGHCPNCGQATISVPGSLFKINTTCSACGLIIDRGEGAFLGPLVINYSVTVFVLLAPVVILYATGILGTAPTIALAGAVGLGAPLLLYRISWAWWLTVYYFFLPENLPSNLEGGAGTDE